MTSWTETPLAAFDLETTSPDPHTARIVSACVLRIDGGQVVRGHWIANPGIPIPAEATEIHGFTGEYVQKRGHLHDQVVAEVVAERIRQHRPGVERGAALDRVKALVEKWESATELGTDQPSIVTRAFAADVRKALEGDHTT